LRWEAGTELFEYVSSKPTTLTKLMVASKEDHRTSIIVP